MALVCPTVLADSPEAYKRQVEKISHLGHRIQIDLTDGQFAASKTVTPEEVWWPVGFLADIHLMYKDPMAAASQLLPHQPHLLIIHAEADGDFDKFASMCQQRGVKVGVALLPGTPPELIFPALAKIDHAMIFSGELGNFGGHAELGLLEKIKVLKSRKAELEIGWDGGINEQNISELILGGVDVLNVGGYIQKADNPQKAYHILQLIADETGTT